METAKYFANLAILPAAVKSKIELAEQNIKLAYMLKSTAAVAAGVLIKAAEENKRQVDILADYRLDLEDVIAELRPLSRELLTLHCLQGKTWAATAEALGYSVEYVKRDLYRQALREVERRELLKPIIERYGVAL